MNTQAQNITDTRASSFKQIVGQQHIIEYLSMAIRAWRLARTPLEHTIFLGPKGLGKTTLATALANEAGVSHITVMGSDLKRIEDFIARVMQLRDGDIIFVEETHMIPQRVQEKMLVPLEQFKFEGYDQNRKRCWVNLPKFVFVGATTDAGLLLGTFSDRIGYKPRLLEYNVAQLQRIITERAQRTYGITLPVEVSELIASLSRKTSRIAINFLASVVMAVQAKNNGKLESNKFTKALVQKVVQLQNIDPLIGLDLPCRNYLRALMSEEKGKAFGANILATIIKEKSETVELNIEPYLVCTVVLPIYVEKGNIKFLLDGSAQDKLVKVTARGRIATDLAYTYMEMCRRLQQIGWFPGEDLG